MAFQLRFLAAALLLVCCAPANAAQIVKLATVAPEGSHWHSALREIEQSWEELSGGAIDVRIFAGGIAGSDSDVVRKLRIGQLNAATLDNFGMSEISADSLALSVPMTFRSNEEYLYVREQMRPSIEAALDERGFKVLTWSDIGWAYFFSRSAVVHPDDLKTLRLGTLGNQTTIVDAWRAAGFRPVATTYPELLTALQSKLVEAIITVPAGALAFQWYRAAPHMTDLPIAPVPGALLITNDAWNKIPADLRPRFLEAANRIGAAAEADLPGLERDAIDAMKARGLTIHAVPAPALTAWEERAGVGADAIVGSTVPAAAYAEVERLLKEYRGLAGAQ